MIARLAVDGEVALPPPERRRSAREASRVGVDSNSRFDRTLKKTQNARRLRRDSTEVEIRLWNRLRNRQLGVEFRRQHPVGEFVLDFFAPAIGLAVELDGGQHAEALHAVADKRRSGWLNEHGVIVMRFWNSDIVQNLPGVLEVIAIKIANLRSSGMTPTRRWRADLPLSGGGKKAKGRA